MPTALISHIKRKASHRSKERVKLRFHVVVYSVTGGPRSVANAIFTLERGEHAFESHAAAQARASRCTRVLRCVACVWRVARADVPAARTPHAFPFPRSAFRAPQRACVSSQADGSFFWNERISQVVTLYRNEDGSYEDKARTPRGARRRSAPRCLARSPPHTALATRGATLARSLSR
jgi:hypothetical protein